jgi:alkylation response protein AidB-like acyl-CoA dehydrogenase
MDFELTEERRMLADSLTRFLGSRYAFSERDRIAHSAAGFSRTLWQQFGELGTIGALFDARDGGFGGAGDDIAVVFECLGRSLVVEPFLPALVAGQMVAKAGSEAQRQWLAPLIAGESVLAFAHGEPDARYTETRVSTRATRERTAAGADGWRLDGRKAVVLAGGAADGYVVSARTAGADDDARGISLFLVPRATPGVSVRDYPLIDGGRGAELTLAQAQLGADALLGREHEGFPVLDAAVGSGLLALSAEALGAMETAFAMTLDYLRTRRQFGVPIGSFQALQHRMADLAIDIEQARSAVINAATALDGPTDARACALSAAKFTVGQVGTRLARESVQLHGGIGMTWELPLSHYAKRLTMIDHQFGDEDHHLARYIGLRQARTACLGDPTD